MLVVEVLQFVLLGAIAVWLGWRPGAGASALVFVAAWLLGTAAFAGLGLLLAGTLRAEATLAVTNAAFIACLLLGGIVVPVDHLPAPLAARRKRLAGGGAVGRVPGSARGRRGTMREGAGDPRRLGGRGGHADRPDLPLGVGLPRVSRPSGR